MKPYKPLNEQGEHVEVTCSPCRGCNRAVPMSVLLDHGGLCTPCFNEYCAQPMPAFKPKREVAA